MSSETGSMPGLDDAGRPPGWSDEDWALLEALIENDGRWLYPAHHPDTYPMTTLGLTVAHHAQTLGYRPEVPRDEPFPDWDEGLEVRWRDDDGVVYYLAQRGPEIWARLEPVPISGAALEALAIGSVGLGQTRQVEERDGQLHVRVGVQMDAGDGPGHGVAAAFRAIVDLAYNQRVSLALAPSDFGYRDLVDTFVRSGLVVPVLPSALGEGLHKLDDWLWSMGLPAQPDRLEEYRFLDGWAEQPLPDHVTVSHGGHGINSYALTWRMAWGPVAMRIQDLWGGAGSTAEDAGRLAVLFGQVRRVVRALEERGIGPRTGASRRTLTIESSMRRRLCVRVWDPAHDTWSDVRLPDQNPWDHIAELARTVPLNR